MIFTHYLSIQFVCRRQVIRAILALENASSTDAAIREKIASLPREVSDVALLQKVNDQHTLDSLRKQVTIGNGVAKRNKCRSF